MKLLKSIAYLILPIAIVNNYSYAMENKNIESYNIMQRAEQEHEKQIKEFAESIYNIVTNVLTKAFDKEIKPYMQESEYEEEQILNYNLKIQEKENKLKELKKENKIRIKQLICSESFIKEFKKDNEYGLTLLNKLLDINNKNIQHDQVMNLLRSIVQKCEKMKIIDNNKIDNNKDNINTMEQDINEDVEKILNLYKDDLEHDEEFQEMIANEQKKYDEEIKRLESELKALQNKQIQQDIMIKEEFVKELVTEHLKDIPPYTKQLENIACDVKKKVEECKKEFDREVITQEELYNNELKNLNGEQQRKLKQLENEYKKKLNEKRTSYEQEIENTKKLHFKNLEEHDEKYKQKLEKLKNELEENRIKYEKTLQKRVEENKTRVMLNKIKNEKNDNDINKNNNDIMNQNNNNEINNNYKIYNIKHNDKNEIIYNNEKNKNEIMENKIIEPKEEKINNNQENNDLAQEFNQNINSLVKSVIENREKLNDEYEVNKDTLTQELMQVILNQKFITLFTKYISSNIQNDYNNLYKYLGNYGFILTDDDILLSIQQIIFQYNEITQKYPELKEIIDKQYNLGDKHKIVKNNEIQKNLDIEKEHQKTIKYNKKDLNLQYNINPNKILNQKNEKETLKQKLEQLKQREEDTMKKLNTKVIKLIKNLQERKILLKKEQMDKFINLITQVKFLTLMRDYNNNANKQNNNRDNIIQTINNCFMQHGFYDIPYEYYDNISDIAELNMSVSILKKMMKRP